MRNNMVLEVKDKVVNGREVMSDVIVCGGIEENILKVDEMVVRLVSR